MSSKNTDRAMRAAQAGQSVWRRTSAAGLSRWAAALLTGLAVAWAWFSPSDAQAAQRAAPVAAQAASGGGWGGCSVWCAEPVQRKAPPRTKKSFLPNPAGDQESDVKTYSEIPANEADIERSIQANGLTADRVTPQRISELMADVVFKTAEPVGTSTFVHAFLDGRFFLGTGHSACVNPANFNAEIGERIARDNAERIARDKLWELEGYALYIATAGVLPDINKTPDDFPLETGESDAVIPARFTTTI